MNKGNDYQDQLVIAFNFLIKVDSKLRSELALVNFVYGIQIGLHGRVLGKVEFS